MNIQKLTNRLQDIGHSGHSQNEVYVRVLDSYYKVGDIQRVVVDDKTIYAIKTEPMGYEEESGKEKSNNEN